MTKADQIKAIAAAAGITQPQAHAAYGALVGAINGTLAAGERIHVDGLGAFTVRDRAARTGRNPQTGEAVEIPAGRKVHFSPSKELKDLL